jgi:6-pyruvoyltetrahydropterin/6-carboxytetrahydropterin synthase|tara:strand:- start:412 stop:774 length:363 start_codon:yes stop_codon:yes gene_type:complete
MEVFKEFRFEAAHFLPNVGEGHQCARMHGHSYLVTVHVEGEVGEDTGWVVDYATISKAFEPIHRMLDHRILNDVAGLENSTAETLAKWIWDWIEAARLLPGLSQIVVKETPTAGCVYRGG